jgi:transcriptional regulator with XRE-family HTH domain
MSDPVSLDPCRRPRPLLRKLVGDVLRRHRRQQGRTLTDVARAARVSMQYLSEIERGRKEASSEVLAAVCAALRIDLSDLLAEAWHDRAAQPGAPAELRAPTELRAPAKLVPRRRAPAGWIRGRTTPARGSAEVVLMAA